MQEQPSDVLHLLSHEFRFAPLELHFALMVQQHGLQVKDGFARVEPLLPAPKNTTPSQTSAKPYLALLSFEIQLNQLAHVILLIQLSFSASSGSIRSTQFHNLPSSVSFYNEAKPGQMLHAGFSKLDFRGFHRT